MCWIPPVTHPPETQGKTRDAKSVKGGMRMKIKTFFTKIRKMIKKFKVTKISIKTHFIDVDLVPVKITYKCSYKKKSGKVLDFLLSVFGVWNTI